MIGGARRQLPSWMVKSKAVDKASNSQAKEEKNKEIDSEKLDPKSCETQNLLSENESHLLKKCKARGSKRKSRKEEKDEGDGDDLDGSDLVRKVDVKAKKRIRCRDETRVLKKCETSKRERMSNEKPKGQVDDLCESDKEKKVRRSYRGNVPRRKTQIAKEHDETVESTPSEDEFTMEDLISFAEEYVKADREKEIRKSESETKALVTETFNIGSEKDITAHVKDKVATDAKLSTVSLLTKPSISGATIINHSNTRDPVREVLEMFMGPLLKSAEELERKTDSKTENMILGRGVRKRSQNDTEAEVPPVKEKENQS